MLSNASPATTDLAISTIGYGVSTESASVIRYRSLWPQDFSSLKAAHHALFPIDYDDNFFQNAVTGQDRIFSYAAIDHQGGTGMGQLAGFITAKVLTLSDCDPQDRHMMGLSSRALDREVAVYILTLGVLPAWRHRGIASQLLDLAKSHAYSIHSKLLFLHVIAYNTGAISLYTRNRYRCTAVLPSFYHISTGRQPYPHQHTYDAYLYTLQLAPWTPQPSYLTQLVHALSPICCGMLPLTIYQLPNGVFRSEPSAPPENEAPPPDSSSFQTAPLPQDSPCRTEAIPMWNQNPCAPPDPPSATDTMLQWLFNPNVRWQ